ncbi:hypothetical protein BHU72_09870 [Desulfuribacillus stibiiarsenatis]|uniref:histidine kinase n=1 Tax=Desulfuribacillus stibiiarsenatis TaxID=1390249 RepID=A0A1E5L363_9FIRM|nr:ATP-binding protein [Desulfuribacillus stibiiarsenatis]OEH84503.1 hypothetical protein BHU72_09870 [Desulfuribacillus stibiiarsenatis]
MRKKLIVLFFCVLLYVGMYQTLSYVTDKDEKFVPSATEGIIDFIGWDFEGELPIHLKGEWEFYPNRLLHPIDFSRDNMDVYYVDVPSIWPNDTDDVLSDFGQATYRLQIHTDREGEVFGLKTNIIRMSNRMYFNGEVVGGSGVPGDKRNYDPENTPYVSYFPLKDGMNELIVQVANYHYMAGGGIASPIYFGTERQISHLRDMFLMHDFVMVTALFVMGLYLIGLYFQRREDKSLLIFALYSLSISLFSSLHGEKILYLLFPDMPYGLVLRTQFASALVGNIVLYLYLYYTYKTLTSIRIVCFGVLIGALFLLYQVIFPTYVPYYVHYFNYIYVVCTSIYFTYIFMLAALEKKEGTWYLIIAVTMMSIYSMTHMLNMFGKTVPPYFPFETIIFILMLALLLSLRFSNAFKNVASLSEELIKVDKLKDEFLAKTSHEFKTPLHGIQNISQSMLNNPQENLTDGQKENLSLIVGIAKRLSTLVNDVLDLEKLKQGELRIVYVPVDIHGTVDILLKVFSFIAKEKEIQLINDIPKSIPYVLADEIRFRQIVSNLLDNAIKYTSMGEVRISANIKGEGIEVSIADTGVGMDQEQLNDIFNPFFQVEATEGAGLGLSIVKQLLEIQGGQIAVRSVVGVGTTFIFSLPIAQLQDTSKLVAVANDLEKENRFLVEYMIETPYISKHEGKFSILIVDDNFSNLKILIELLESEQYHVIAVKNGEEALEQIKQAKIDLVILDLMMPGMSGYEVCTHIRKMYSVIEMPILMVTASHHTEEKLASFQAGANDFLPKPFDLAELQARVDNLLMMKQSSRKATTLEIAFLQSQIKPHFLFNVLNTISSLSYTNIEKSREVVAYLADYLRGSFDFSNTNKFIPFQKELNLINAYVEIEKARFKNKIKFEVDIPSDIHLNIPPLIIQPLVENAIRHGISKKKIGGTIKLLIETSNGECSIIIEDDGIGMEQEKVERLLTQETESRSVGLKNINQRLKYFFGTSLHISSKPSVGTKITIVLPFEKMKELSQFS